MCENFSNHWKVIGLELGVNIMRLEIIYEDNRDSYQRMFEMLALWLRRKSETQPVPSWHILLKALSKWDIIKTIQIASKFVCNHK